MARIAKSTVLLANYHTPGQVEAGCDEAGRGCLAGPVVAAAVILPEDCHLPDLNDSKLLKAEQRAQQAALVKDTALAWAVASCSPAEIDELNILWASVKAMHRALDALKQRPEFVLVDGNQFRPWGFVPFSCEVKGDSRFASIAAASVLAKTHRDAWMQELDAQHPGYGWAANMGYPTPAHKAALADLGPTPWHRKSFKGVVA